MGTLRPRFEKADCGKITTVYGHPVLSGLSE